MFNPRTFENSRPDGFPVLEIIRLLDDADGARQPDGEPIPPRPTPEPEKPGRFVPLRRTELRGEVAGPVALLRVSQEYLFTSAQFARPIEAAYRFPLPGDAAVTGVLVRFGEVEIRATLAEREAAEQEYRTARDEGRQAALLTREAPDVFTLQVAGLKPDEPISIETSYAQLARPEGEGWSLRVPLTTVPRFVRGDERGSQHAEGQPLVVLRDPGHRFALDLEVEGAEDVASPTHALDETHGRSDAGDGRARIRLRDGEVIPDRDFVLTWRSRHHADRPTLTVLQHVESGHAARCFLALVAPPAAVQAEAVPREVILLIDHSGSMSGPKWEAADWAVQNLLAGLTPADTFNLGLFHDSTRWFVKAPVRGDERTIKQARDFLLQHKDSGGTELGVALEQALGQARDREGRSRHVIIVTDAQVSDVGRILALVEREAERADRRRVDVLCIDAAPNSGLANELAERGGGLSRFLTSDPAENDIASALDEVLADWAAPVLRDLTLHVRGGTVQAAGRRVSGGSAGGMAGASGPSGTGDAADAIIDLGDLPGGRAVWVAGRVTGPSDGAGSVGSECGPAPTFRLLSEGREIASVPADSQAGRTGHPAIAALFGARRVLDLELVQSSGIDAAERLRQLGYYPNETARESADAADADPPLYAENARVRATSVLQRLLVGESLRYGIACSATAFVATRQEAGQRVAGTVPVANALAHGWSEDFVTGGVAFARVASIGGAFPMAAPMAPPMPAPLTGAPPTARPGRLKRLQSFFGKADSASPPSAPAGRPVRGFAEMAASSPPTYAEEEDAAVPAGLAVVFSGTPRFSNGEAVLFDSGSGGASLSPGDRLSRLVVRIAGGGPSGSVDAGLVLALFVDDLTAPRARVRLADLLRQGGERPLNVRRRPGQAVRLVLLDPAGSWAAGAPSLEIRLG